MLNTTLRNEEVEVQLYSGSSRRERQRKLITGEAGLGYSKALGVHAGDSQHANLSGALGHPLISYICPESPHLWRALLTFIVCDPKSQWNTQTGSTTPLMLLMVLLCAIITNVVKVRF